MLASHSFGSWVGALQGVCGRFDARQALNSALFIGEVGLRDYAGLEVAQIRTNAGLISRKSTSVDHEDDRHCFLIMQRSGHAQISQGGERIELAPGEMALLDSAGACEIVPHGLIEHASLHLSRDEVYRHLPAQQRKFGKLSQNCASGRLMRLLVEQICGDELQGCAAQQEGQALQEALIALLGPTLRQTPGASLDGYDSQHGGCLRSQARQLINQSLTEPGLTPVSLASQMNISVRQLYRLFEEQGDSVCRFIQRARLDRSAADLSNPRLRHASITDIAFKWGFTDSAHFSRTFKKHFEQSPRDYRARSLNA
ncbi:transcriptional regulator FeaR [Pseudomonas chlororaphis]|uniref:Transcriptional regulator, AraC family n=1 Tax=Pseudomonas chlororaphis TaxID=587753 RepID=A0AAX3FNE5_9PSED|nr:transcriptional regulator FeaR [Pseudomonas chlororaphis]AZC37750.1 Transcriptional regulator, AraC family [Pseudomonas chlororaphis subsp. piscium]AZC44298.1 Transcriptional regulator, AraC family [Pseudomonas chlororaphis subsp. piscium]AZC50958.1 Transcriptional regulator, AraC family [Pseudomonas chlororaphis subsp. piscium]AZC57530.1 Transcriptional regulator, AraC family [Pseudomonas chlororaphis subsp. piscium]AZC63756.1 Transcriptional regulator, AraC family [Pseudomonas chlororaphi